MADTFTIDEAFEIAVQIEKNGARFYRKAAGKFEVSGGKGILMDLAAMEDHHEKIFEEMRLEIVIKSGMEDTDPDEHPGQYLKAVAGGYVFPLNTDPSDRLTGKESLEDILHFAIQIEKDSIVFYLGIRELIPENLGKFDISKIIKEEMSHITVLSALMDKIK